MSILHDHLNYIHIPVFSKQETLLQQSPCLTMWLCVYSYLPPSCTPWLEKQQSQDLQGLMSVVCPFKLKQKVMEKHDRCWVTGCCGTVYFPGGQWSQCPLVFKIDLGRLSRQTQCKKLPICHRLSISLTLVFVSKPFLKSVCGPFPRFFCKICKNHSK